MIVHTFRLELTSIANEASWSEAILKLLIMKIVKVDFSAGGDGITALYIDEKLHTYGDYYHDKINDWIIGFVSGLEFAKFEFTYEEVFLEEENKWVEDTGENGNPPPKNYEDLFS